MYIKKIKYTDYNGVERSEDFYFNLSRGELAEMELGVSGGLTGMIKSIINTNDTPAIMNTLKTFIMKAYGVKSNDGKRFIKSDELSIEFTQTEAYSELLMEMFRNPEYAADFIKAILPADMVEMLPANPAATAV